MYVRDKEWSNFSINLRVERKVYSYNLNYILTSSFNNATKLDIVVF
jgi:hypothetical protein